MTGADEKRVHHLAERKGFRLDKVGKGQHRFYLIDVGSGGKCLQMSPATNSLSHSKKLKPGWSLAAIKTSRDLGRRGGDALL